MKEESTCPVKEEAQASNDSTESSDQAEQNEASSKSHQGPQAAPPVQRWFSRWVKNARDKDSAKGLKGPGNRLEKFLQNGAGRILLRRQSCEVTDLEDTCLGLNRREALPKSRSDSALNLYMKESDPPPPPSSPGAVKGLPGFLRRTLRNPQEEENTSSRTRFSSKSTPSSGGETAASNAAVASESSGAADELSKLPSKKPPALDATHKNQSDRATAAASDSSVDAKKDDEERGGNRVQRMSYKQAAFEKCIISPIVNMRDLRRLGWNGIPPQYRARSWKILLGYLPANASRRQTALDRKRQEYRDAIAQHYDIDDRTRTLQEQETLRQVLVDVPRTAPDVGLFRNNRIRRCLSRLLYIWAMRHPASSYVQGINDLVTPLVAVFLSDYFGGKDMTSGEGVDDVSDEVLGEVEADSYWCLTNLLNGIQDHYTSDQPGVQRMVFRLEELIQRIDADLCAHLRSTGIEFMQFAFKWMNCLLLREFSLHSIMRLWDTYLSEGDGGFEDFHVYVCAAFLCQFSNELQHMEFDELFGFMQNMPTADWGDTEVEVLLSQAYVLSTLFGGSDAHLTSGASTRT